MTVQDVKLRIGEIPSVAELKRLSDSGVTALVNVSGAALGEIYPNGELVAFSLSEFVFSDVFSDAKPYDAIAGDAISGDLFAGRVVPEMREGFVCAAQRVYECVCEDRPTYVFCHRGVGRSPAVVLAGLALTTRFTMSEAVNIVMHLRASASITSMTLSGAYFARQSLRSIL